MRVKLRYGGILKCGALSDDDRRCPEQFLSYSLLSLLRRQAGLVGWGRVPTWQITGALDDGSRKLDVCPTHRQVAATNKARKAEIVAAEKAQKVAERALAQAQKTAARAAQLAAWSAKRVAKAEARAARDQRRAERAERDAKKATQRSEKAAERAAQKVAQQAARDTQARAKRLGIKERAGQA